MFPCYRIALPWVPGDSEKQQYNIAQKTKVQMQPLQENLDPFSYLHTRHGVGDRCCVVCVVLNAFRLCAIPGEVIR